MSKNMKQHQTIKQSYKGCKSYKGAEADLSKGELGKQAQDWEISQQWRGRIGAIAPRSNPDPDGQAS
ncbi:hypothetical protein [Limnothrix redekei]|uniref:hypothetical protein n=1 Tax=Limnothrix redekei TaxID=132606 RepID=UPI00371B410C